MSGIATPVRRWLAGRRYPGLQAPKRGVIDRCFEAFACDSFADLGGVWAVEGGYSCYAAYVHRPSRGVIVDDDLSDEFRRRAKRLPNLEAIRGNFGDPSMPHRVGRVDALFAFDILLHQVAPDWDELLGMYAPHCSVVAIVQPQWNGTETVRLLDLGEEEYRSVVPDGDSATYDDLFKRLDEVNERRQRPWRDVHDIWQWGIDDESLVGVMEGLGFSCRFHSNNGPWRGSDSFHEGAFIFVR